MRALNGVRHLVVAGIAVLQLLTGAGAASAQGVPPSTTTTTSEAPSVITLPTTTTTAVPTTTTLATTATESTTTTETEPATTAPTTAPTAAPTTTEVPTTTSTFVPPLGLPDDGSGGEPSVSGQLEDLPRLDPGVGSPTVPVMLSLGGTATAVAIMAVQWLRTRG